MIRKRKRQYDAPETNLFIPDLKIDLAQDEIIDGQGTARLQQSDDSLISSRSDNHGNAAYLNWISDDYAVHQFILRNRADKIQNRYKPRFAKRKLAAKVLQTYFKKAMLRAGHREMRNARINF